LFTQKRILQPKTEARLYGQNNEVRGTGSGLSDLSFGLRRRYEFTRQFAPYIGVEWAGLYGGTTDFASADNDPTEEPRWVAG
jgi:copper resistance protein B